MTNPLVDRVLDGLDETVAGAVAGRSGRPSVIAHVAKSAAKSVALAPVTYAKDLGSTLVQGALMAIPGYYLTKTVLGKVKRSYDNIRDKAEAMERQIERQTKSEQREADKALKEAKKLDAEAEKEEKEKQKALTKEEAERRKIAEKNAKALYDAQVRESKERQKAFETAWKEAEREEKKRQEKQSKGQNPGPSKPPKLPEPPPPPKIPEPPIAKPRRPSNPGASARAYKKRFERIAVLEKKIADLHSEVSGLVTIIKGLTEQGITTTKENIKLGTELAKVVETMGDQKRQAQIAALQEKESALEASRKDPMIEALQVTTAAQEEQNGFIESVVKGLVGKEAVIAAVAAGGAILSAVPGLIAASPALAAIAASVLSIYGVLKAITPDEKGMNMVENAYDDALKSLDPELWKRDRLKELADLDASMALRQKMIDDAIAAAQKYEKGSFKRKIAEATIGMDIQTQKQAKKKRDYLHNELGMYQIKTGQGLVYDNAIELSDEDKEALIRLMKAEAGSESELGRAAVAYSVLNRVMISQKDNSRPFGQKENSVQGIINAPGQYDAVMFASQKARGLSGDARDISFQPDWKDIPALTGAEKAEYMAIIEKMINGKLPDPTGGATFYLNRAIGTDFSNAENAYLTQIGNHTFYDASAVNKKYSGSTIPYDFKTKQLDVVEPTISRPPYETQISEPEPLPAPNITLIVPPEEVQQQTPKAPQKGPEDNNIVTSPYNNDMTFNQETRANAYG